MDEKILKPSGNVRQIVLGGLLLHREEVPGDLRHRHEAKREGGHAKKALDKLLPPEWTVPVYTENAADIVDRPLVAELQLSEEREEDVRTLFKKADKDPKILIVTDKLLTGYDAPLLYCLYLDKPMRDHVLLQAVARVNRPYVDGQGIQKRVGLVVDFVGVLRELRKALQFDSADVSGVIEDLDVLLGDFKQKIAKAGPSCAITSRPSIVWRNSTPPFHRLVEENATQQGLGRVTKSVTFDVKTLESPARRQRTGRGQGIQPGPTTAGGTRSKKFPHLTVMT